ncbi:acyl-CoA N-acyltransferase [Meredithblackwellia eburnea MCA 4105]
MSLLRPFSATDLFNFNPINLDAFTETYGVSYYLSYANNWADLFSVVESAGGQGRISGAGEGGGLMGYVMGKTEGQAHEWHAHVSAITVSPGHRRLGLASMMMDLLESVGERERNWFVDLFARESNERAIGLYESLGYMIYRRVVGYYGGAPGEEDEDGFDMRKPLKRDKGKGSIKLPGGAMDGRDVRVRPEDVYF